MGGEVPLVVSELPGLDDLTSQTVFVFEEFQPQMDLSLDLLIRVHLGEVQPAVYTCTMLAVEEN